MSLSVTAPHRAFRLKAALAAGCALAGLLSAPAFAADQATTETEPSKAADVAAVVVNGVPYKETVLPTRMSSSSTYGLDLSVMETPRNTTLLSTTQLQTLNVQDPRAFSYLTASSYTDSAFGTPNIPRIRGQYADVFFNGIRSSFTENGYGVPPNFDVIDTLDITKGPASVVDGPGPDVGGEVNFLTKRPSLTKTTIQASASLDTVNNRRATVDVSGPLQEGVLGARISYSGEDSGSYFPGHYFRKNAVYVAVRWQPNDTYRADFNGQINVQQYTENVGLNRVNQSLIDNRLYLTGAPISNPGSSVSTLYGYPLNEIGSPNNPYAPVAPIFTPVNLSGFVPISTRTTIDQTPLTSSKGVTGNLQLIQTWNLSNGLSIENNAFFDYQDSQNVESYYYADSSRGSWSFEDRTELKAKSGLPFGLGSGAQSNQVVMGFTGRWTHVNYISNFSAETPSVYDLTTSPALWVFSNDVQYGYADAYDYKGPLGRALLGTPGRDVVNAGNSGISNVWDVAAFFQDRAQLTDALSLLFGLRLDAVQAHSYDPLGGADCPYCYSSTYFGTAPPQSHTTDVYGLANSNISAVYRAAPWVSGYATFDFTQSTNPNGGEGGINAYQLQPDHVLMRADSYLYETGLKFNLLNNKLFVGTAAFDQKRNVPTGAGGTQTAAANIRGIEIEANYQPNRNLFVTASYSYIETTLNRAAGFYNYAAEPGTFIDGAGTLAVWAPGQKFKDPGVPEQVFNFLGNYKFENGLGVRLGMQVTGPILTTTSGQLLIDPNGGSGGLAQAGYASYVPASVLAKGGFYQAPVIPWQYTLNASVFYEVKGYTVTASVYNLTNQLNWQSSTPFYGADFLVRNDPRTYELRVSGKF
jgi:outer membrane receptor protein involved in Fe transport